MYALGRVVLLSLLLFTAGSQAAGPFCNVWDFHLPQRQLPLWPNSNRLRSPHTVMKACASVTDQNLAALTIRRQKEKFDNWVDSVKQNWDTIVLRAGDAIIAATGLAGTLSLLGVAEARYGIKLFASPMMATGVIFFSAQQPPGLYGIAVGTAGAAALSMAFLSRLAARVPVGVTYGIACGFMLVWYKFAQQVFSPTTGLAVVMSVAAAQQAGAGAAKRQSAKQVLKFLAFPWGAGISVLYMSSWAFSAVREQFRVSVMGNSLQKLGAEASRSKLRQVFKRYDTSGDGALDAMELRLALRLALGQDISLHDCEDFIRKTDTDGNGTIDFDEFYLICHGKVF